MKSQFILLASLLLGLVVPFQIVQAETNNDDSVDGSIRKELTEIPAHDFSLQSLSGKEIKLSDYKGKKVMLHFWATWCPPCKWEMSHLQKLYERGQNYIEILAINIDPENDVQGFVKNYQLTFPVLLDKTGEVNEGYSILSIPTSILVNEEGQIVKKQIGAMTLEQMEEFIIE